MFLRSEASSPWRSRVCRDRSRRMHFAAKHSADFSSQPEVPIVWQRVSICIQSQPISLCWRVCPRRGSLQDGGTFVHLIKHGDLDDRGSTLSGVKGLSPQEFTTQPRNLVFRLVAVEVVPREPREDYRHVQLMILLGEGDIRNQ